MLVKVATHALLTMCGHCEVAGKQIIMRRSFQRSDIVKTHFDLLKYPQVDMLNVGQGYAL